MVTTRYAYPSYLEDAMKKIRKVCTRRSSVGWANLRDSLVKFDYNQIIITAHKKFSKPSLSYDGHRRFRSCK